MKNFPYLLRRNGIYYFRRAIPNDLRYVLGRAEITKSLRTPDVKIARKLAITMSEELDNVFSRIRDGIQLLSNHDATLIESYLVQKNTKSLLIEAYEEYSNSQPGEEEWEAFHARTYRQEVLGDLRYSRLNSEEPRVDHLLPSPCFDFTTNFVTFLEETG